MDKEKRCIKIIYIKDTYRYTGRGKGGFELHYSKRQCIRSPLKGTDFCWQHSNEYSEEKVPKGSTL